jgi:hypothetical protein
VSGESPTCQLPASWWPVAVHLGTVVTMTVEIVAVALAAAAVAAVIGTRVFRHVPAVIAAAGVLGLSLASGVSAAEVVGPLLTKSQSASAAKSGDGHEHEHGAPLVGMPVVRAVAIDPAQDGTVGDAVGSNKAPLPALPDDLYEKLISGMSSEDVLREMAGEVEAAPARK